MTEVEEIRIWGIHTKDDNLFLKKIKLLQAGGNLAI